MLSIVNLYVAGDIPNISCWTILYPPLINIISYISPNCFDGGMLTFFREEVSIECTVDDKIYCGWLGAFNWGTNVIDI